MTIEALAMRGGLIFAKSLGCNRVDPESNSLQWVSYALKQAGPELELDLRLRCLPIYCPRPSPTSLEVPAGSGGAAAASTQEQKEDLTVDGDEIDDDPRVATTTMTSSHSWTSILHGLALRCCHNLAGVTVDASELSVFEYRGAVPEITFLTTFGAKGWFLAMPSLASCTVDVCGGEVSSEELDRLTAFLQHFASAKHLRLRSARLGPGVGRSARTRLPTFTKLRHLELRGHLPHDDDGATIIGTTSRILRHAANLEVLSLIFETGTTTADDDGAVRRGRYRHWKEVELLDAHILKYNRYNVLVAPSVVIPCLANRLREINLVH
ncbi:hypothetical protein VPH35_136299 [Triticum aestivum]